LGVLKSRWPKPADGHVSRKKTESDGDAAVVSLQQWLSSQGQLGGAAITGIYDNVPMTRLKGPLVSLVANQTMSRKRLPTYYRTYTSNP
jgi:hypothetical protein